jgi:peptide deformylase
MMTRADIITLPDRRLRQKSDRIHVVTKTTRQLVSDMQTATLDWEEHRPHELGVALAAVQVGKMQRVVIVRNNFDNKDDRTFISLINPEIVKLEGEVTYDHEGCLSVPDVYGLVPRHTKIRLKALDEEGHEIRLKAEGFLARVLQHEIDHTQGIVFIDHIRDQDAFFRLDPDGKLTKVAHATILKNHILWK